MLKVYFLNELVCLFNFVLFFKSLITLQQKRQKENSLFFSGPYPFKYCEASIIIIIFFFYFVDEFL